MARIKYAKKVDEGSEKAVHAKIGCTMRDGKHEWFEEVDTWFPRATKKGVNIARWVDCEGVTRLEVAEWFVAVKEKDIEKTSDAKVEIMLLADGEDPQTGDNPYEEEGYQDKLDEPLAQPGEPEGDSDDDLPF